MMCEYGSKHIAEEHVIVETVDDNGKTVMDKPGRILVTDLDNHAMPLIRYEIGDCGILTSDACKCGRQLTVIKALKGRLQDAICTPDGKRLPAIFFLSKFRNLTSVTRYQLVQKKLKEVDLNYVPKGTGAIQDVGIIADEIKMRLGEDFTVNLIELKSIPLTVRGKSRLVIGYQASQGAEKKI